MRGLAKFEKNNRLNVVRKALVLRVVQLLVLLVCAHLKPSQMLIDVIICKRLWAIAYSLY